jgi:hypothetical protein
MNKLKSSVRCGNCGTVWTPDEPLQFGSSQGEWGYTCPVCQYHVTAGDSAASIPLTAAEFQARLGALLAEARAGGLAPDELVPILRDELEFEAELAHHGRRILIQIIDLGSVEVEMVAMPEPDRREMIQNRVVGQ